MAYPWKTSGVLLVQPPYQQRLLQKYNFGSETDCTRYRRLRVRLTVHTCAPARTHTSTCAHAPVCTHACPHADAHASLLSLHPLLLFPRFGLSGLFAFHSPRISGEESLCDSNTTRMFPQVRDPRPTVQANASNLVSAIYGIASDSTFRWPG